MSRYVGVDLHRRRSQVVILDENGERVSSRQIENDPLVPVEAVGEAGCDAEVVLEATWGWYWAVDVSRVGTRSVAQRQLGCARWGGIGASGPPSLARRSAAPSVLSQPSLALPSHGLTSIRRVGPDPREQNR